jgi:hypothetical protein
MDDFELRLKGVSWSKPSAGLGRRIFGKTPGQPSLRAIFQRRIRLGWAAAFSLAVGVAGFLLSDLLSGASSEASLSPGTTLEVQIIESPSSRHDFDFARVSRDFLSGDVAVRVETEEEI